MTFLFILYGSHFLICVDVVVATVDTIEQQSLGFAEMHSCQVCDLSNLGKDKVTRFVGGACCVDD